MNSTIRTSVAFYGFAYREKRIYQTLLNVREIMLYVQSESKVEPHSKFPLGD